MFPLQELAVEISTSFCFRSNADVRAAAAALRKSGLPRESILFALCEILAPLSNEVPSRNQTLSFLKFR